MKRIVICCDGTWNTLAAESSTNVVHVAKSVLPTASDGTRQVIFYDEGVGTHSSLKGAFLRRINMSLSAAFGWGLLDRLEAAYRFLVFNYKPGDELYIFGFSRGAFTARSLAGLIRNCGIPAQRNADSAHEAVSHYKTRDEAAHPDADLSCALRYRLCPHLYLNELELRWRRSAGKTVDEHQLTKLRVRYLGVWDTVGALGIPKHLLVSNLFNSGYQFHDTNLSSSVQSARHAVAVDERRKAFEPALWDNIDKLNHEQERGKDARYQQLWFPGDHTSVGGGGSVSGLSSAALIWVINGAQGAGLEFSEEALKRVRGEIDHGAPLDASGKPGFFHVLSDRRGPDRLDHVAPITIQRWQSDKDYRPATLSRIKMPE